MNKKEKRFTLWLKDKNFEKKYLKNIVVDICHIESFHALDNNCYFCNKGLGRKERQDLKKYPRKAYGIRLGSLFNKRHQRNKDDKKYFLSDVCMECLQELEKKLDIKLVRSYAP